jgi:hypothetical protein
MLIFQHGDCIYLNGFKQVMDSRRARNVRIVLPSKGRLHDPASALLHNPEVIDHSVFSGTFLIRTHFFQKQADGLHAMNHPNDQSIP